MAVRRVDDRRTCKATSRAPARPAQAWKPDATQPAGPSPQRWLPAEDDQGQQHDGHAADQDVQRHHPTQIVEHERVGGDHDRDMQQAEQSVNR